MPRLTDFKVLTFDCYGTLIDWETGIWDALQPLLMMNPGSDVVRSKALETFARAEKKIETETPSMLYPDVLAKAHEALAGELGLESTAELDKRFAGSLAHWPAFRDTAEALRFLKKRYKLVVLSNVHRDGFASSNPKLGVDFDAVYTAQDIGAYKPSLRNFEYLLTRLREDHGLEKKDVLHTAQSLFHDHAPAKSVGLASAWIDRQRLSQGGSSGATVLPDERPEPDFLFFTMGEMADAVRAEESA
jgi:2-haloalkanoic acid dehalogenase type II